MSSFLSIFSKKRKIAVESFGKLPFYRDYISLATSQQAIQWKNWLLDTGGWDTSRIPPGTLAFFFHFSDQSIPLAGIIENSSDGIREFPFTLFCSLPKTNKRDFDCTVTDIWETLLNLRQQIHSITTIEQFYLFLQGKHLFLNHKKSNPQSNPRLYSITRTDHLSWPRLIVFPDFPKLEPYIVVPS